MDNGVRLKSKMTSNAASVNNWDIIVQPAENIINALNPDNITLMVTKFKEIPFLGDEHKIFFGAKVVFEKAVQDFDSTKKYADFVHAFCKKMSNVTPKKFDSCITYLCSQELTNIGTMEEEGLLNRKRWIGVVRFIGELYNCQQRNLEGVSECIGILLAFSSDESLQDVCELLTMIGKKMEEQLDRVWNRVKIIQSGVNPYNMTMPRFILPEDWSSTTFGSLERFCKNQKLSLKTRSDIRKLIRFKENGWLRVDNGGATTGNEHPTVKNCNESAALKSHQSVFLPQPNVPVESMSSWSQETALSSESVDSISKQRKGGGPPSIRSNQSGSPTSKQSKESESCDITNTIKESRISTPKQQIHLSNMKPECALVEILKTLNPGNVPAVTLKIMNLPFQDNYECVYSIAKNMLEKSQKDPSFLTNMHIPMDKVPKVLPQPSVKTQIKKTNRASSPLFSQGRDTETQTVNEEAAEVMINHRHTVIDRSINTTNPTIDTASFVTEGSNYEIPCKLLPFPKLTKDGNGKVQDQEDLVIDTYKIKPSESNIALFGNDSISNMNLAMNSTPELPTSSPGLKYQSMYSNYDRMLQQLRPELAEDLNMEISTLIYQRLKCQVGVTKFDTGT